MTTRASAEPTHSATSKSIDMRVAIGASSLGQVLVAESDAGIGSVLIGDNSDVLRRDLEERFPLATLSEGNALTEDLARRIIEYIESPGEGLDIPLIFEARNSSEPYGRRWVKSRPGRQQATRRLRSALESPTQSGQ